MNAFIKTTSLVALLFLANPASADDRMAGPVPGVEQKSKNAFRQQSSSFSDIDTIEIESQGTLTNTRNGGLGIDIWDNSDHDFLAELIKSVPAHNRYNTLQDLSERALLTKNDAKLIHRSNRPDKANDDNLLTIRFEKLMAMGKFEEISNIYSRLPAIPENETLLRNALLAMFYSNQSALACLEEKTVNERYDDVLFWQQTQKICSYILSKDEKEKSSIHVSDSKFINRYIDNPNKKYNVKNLDTLANLQPLEIAFLISDNRLSYSQLSLKDTASLDPFARALLLHAQNLPEALKTKLTDKKDGDRISHSELENIDIESLSKKEQERVLYSIFAKSFETVKSSYSSKSLDVIQKAFDRLPAEKQDLLKISYKKLDKKLELHNYADSKVYENSVDLTFGAGYVMPSVSLVDRLREAKEDKRLGEVVLLSAIILHKIEPENLYSGLFGEVLDSLVSVGLINEARLLTKEILLSLSK